MQPTTTLPTSGRGRGKLPLLLHLLLRRLQRGVRAVFTVFPGGAFVLITIAHEIHSVRLHVVLPGFDLDDEIVGLALRGQSH